MNFSDQWRSLWPISSTFPTPNLLCDIPSNTSIGPLLFIPSPQSLHPFLSLPPISLPPPPLPPPSFLNGLRSFFRSHANLAFLPNSTISSLSLSVSADTDTDTDPFAAANGLIALRLRDPSSFLLLFPSGDNSHHLSFLTVSVSAGVIEPGPVFTQTEGFKHPSHRILRVSVVPASCHDTETLLLPDGVLVEGFLIATTLYSANWFRIERRGSDGRVSLVPVAKQGFESVVVDACCSPHFAEESAVLLESGEVCWFHVGTKRSGKFRVYPDSGGDPSGWFRCEFGAQPWILLVACSCAVFAVDLRGGKGNTPKVLARVDGDDRVVAFCRSRFSGFHVSVVTESRVILFDLRMPLVPILTWNHRLRPPCYVTMLRLSELRQSEGFQWASSLSFAILVGSFWNDQFSVFCYGPRERGDSNDSLLYAWGLPSCFSVSGRHYGPVDSLVKEVNLSDSARRQQKDVVVGFWIVPNDLLKVESEYGGFALIRLLSSGKLEMQSYHASWDKDCEKSNGEGHDAMLELKDSVRCTDQNSRTSTRYSFFKFRHLYGYMTGNLLNVLALHEPRLRCKGVAESSCNYQLKETMSSTVKPSSYPVSAFINNVTVPTNIFEIASWKALNSLEPDLLSLAFSEYGAVFENNVEKTTFPLLEVPSCLPHHTMTHYLVGGISRTRKRPRNSILSKSLVGPVLPVPVLLTLKRIQQKNKIAALEEEPEDDFLALQCKKVLDSCSSSSRDSFEELQHEKFFVYNSSLADNRFTSKGTSHMVRSALKEEASQMGQTQLEHSPDEVFTTFICGTAEKTCYTDNEAVGFEMFDHLNPLRLDYDSISVTFQPREQEMFKRLTRQASKWQKNFKPYKDFMQSVEDAKMDIKNRGSTLDRPMSEIGIFVPGLDSGSWPALISFMVQDSSLKTRTEFGKSLVSSCSHSSRHRHSSDGVHASVYH